MNRKIIILTICFLSLFAHVNAQQSVISNLWVADNGDGTYTNPVIHADYSDPDAIRVGDDYYMIASSMNHAPGLPILHSKDLVNWTLIGHALQTLTPSDNFSKVQHGAGVWAPSIRYHDNAFRIYYPDPDFGIYLVTAKNINGPWSAPILVQAGKGLIDPCPLWDDDGRTYLVHAYAGSRAGIKSIIVVKELNKEGTKVIGDPVMVYDGHDTDPTIEGPKFYKRNDWYYIFAPAGGVPTGWQLVLRSKNIYGPYERRVVMDKGNTNINGPHQGAWVSTQTGEDWFLHFQDKEAYGRVVHLQPMKWVNDWPVIGVDKDGDGKGEPVMVYKKPNVGRSWPKATIAETDEFNAPKLGLQWQWQANPKEGWAFPTSFGMLRMFSVFRTDTTANMWMLPNILCQKLPAENFTASVKLSFKPKFQNERFSLLMLGTDYAVISIVQKDGRLQVEYNTCMKADKDGKENLLASYPLSGNSMVLQVKVEQGAVCHFGFSENEKDYINIGQSFTARPGKWVGAQLGICCTRDNITNDAGYADLDWFRIERNNGR